MLTFTIVQIVVLSGCSFLWPKDSSGIEYVHRKGGPTELGQWALRQKSRLEVDDALSALIRYSAGDDPSNARKAGDAAFAIWERLEQGWLSDPSSERVELDTLYQGCYSNVSWAARFSERSRERFYAMRPDSNHPKRLEEWLYMSRSSNLLHESGEPSQP